MLKLIIIATCIFFVIQYLKKKVGFTMQEPSTKRDPYAILGIQRGASTSDIKNAYHDKLSQNHPDKVAHLSQEIQETARKKTVEIQWAYEQLK